MNSRDEKDQAEEQPADQAEIGRVEHGNLLLIPLSLQLFLLFACSYGLAALCWLAVDVTQPLVPKAQGT